MAAIRLGLVSENTPLGLGRFDNPCNVKPGTSDVNPT